MRSSLFADAPLLGSLVLQLALLNISDASLLPQPSYHHARGPAFYLRLQRTMAATNPNYNRLVASCALLVFVMGQAPESPGDFGRCRGSRHLTACSASVLVVYASAVASRTFPLFRSRQMLRSPN